MSSTVSKRPLPLYALDGGDPALDFAHRWWRARRDGSRLPSRATVDDWVFRLALAGASWIDVRSRAPADWQLAPVAASLPKFPAEPWIELEASLRADFAAIRLSGVAVAQDLGLAGRGGHWRQLILPHADDGLQVQDLLVVVVFRSAPAFGRAGPAAARPKR